YTSTSPIGGKPSIAYYVEAVLKDKGLDFDVTAKDSVRKTPQQYYRELNAPLLVVNATFFDVKTGVNICTVMKDGRLIAYHRHTVPGHGKDTLMYHHSLGSAIGISKKREADVAWVYTDSTHPQPLAFEKGPQYMKDSLNGRYMSRYTWAPNLHHAPTMKKRYGQIENWKMQTAVGGGPVLIQDGQIHITNDGEYRFAGKAIHDRHPRTAMGYTADGRLIILVIEGRHPGTAEGADLEQEAAILKDLGCREALNLDGGGSTCLLVNGKETIKPTDKEGERPVPAVFTISGARK
ncbi:MAG: phosphodiester glycosidase family protein, partial [Bacteroidetes bacterium]|nr:phosphodiester glycosidase family protein [Bacteroidota bacterium]